MSQSVSVNRDLVEMKAAYNHVYCLSKQICWYIILFSAVT